MTENKKFSLFEHVKKDLGLVSDNGILWRIPKKEEKALKITMIPFEYSFCACCMNCLHRGECKLGKYGDRGCCKEYHEDKNAMPMEY